MEKKFYGLIIPKKNEKVKPQKKSIFASDSDDDAPLPKRELKSLPTSKVKSVEKKVLEDDPSIYEYDTIYDSLKEKKAQKQTEKVHKGSRFINSLLKAADKRKKDHERRLEKKIQIERTKEGDEFEDKEAFVTSSYKKKMEEMEKEEEQERIKEQLEDMMDVTKQKDLSGFYRHYLKQTVGEEKIPEFGHGSSSDAGVLIKKEPDSKSDEANMENEKFKKRKSEKSAQYRHRNKSESLSEEEEEIRIRPKEKQKRSNASGEESYDIKIEECETEQHLQADKQSIHLSVASEVETEIPSSVQAAACESVSNLDADEDMSDSDSEAEKANSPDVSTKDVSNQPAPVKKTDMSKKFVKRTVGEVFDQAQARYFKRMAIRGS